MNIRRNKHKITQVKEKLNQTAKETQNRKPKKGGGGGRRPPPPPFLGAAAEGRRPYFVFPSLFGLVFL